MAWNDPEMQQRVKALVERWQDIAAERQCPNAVKHEAGNITCHASTCPCLDQARKDMKPISRGEMPDFSSLNKKRDG
jgi:hypothetical protein